MKLNETVLRSMMLRERGPRAMMEVDEPDAAPKFWYRTLLRAAVLPHGLERLLRG